MTIIKSDIARAIHERVGLPKNEASDLVDSILSLMTQAIRQDGKMAVRDFGTFSTRTKAERPGNAKGTDGLWTPCTIPARTAVAFKACKALRDRIVSGNQARAIAQRGVLVPKATQERHHAHAQL